MPDAVFLVIAAFLQTAIQASNLTLVWATVKGKPYLPAKRLLTVAKILQ